ncbi:PREDICTED: reelin-like [Priapulus caudatus]|uniref:Reelin n=1 Tax=Priapulus caudatus TaxID=37621 RepID=A0ABM1E4J8_PRICU|nr:PREDICTED: reelin-like [Priapulus caudatus]
MVHVMSLPVEARTDGVCLRWHGNQAAKSCWAIDNVVVTNNADRPRHLQDNFDSIDISNWIFFPGAQIRRACQSQGAAAVFRAAAGQTSYIETQDLDLQTPDNEDALLAVEFESNLLPDGWQLTGGTVINGQVVMSGENVRRLCTNNLDLRKAHSIQFQLHLDGTDEVEVAEVEIELKVRGSKQRLTEPIVISEEARVSVSHAIDKAYRRKSVRVCWSQRNQAVPGATGWQIDRVRVLPRVQSVVTHVAQFRISTQCGTPAAESSVALLYSTNKGRNWHPVQTSCLPGQECSGGFWADKSTYHPTDTAGWTIVTMPLPYAALTDSVRFMWRGDKRTNQSWAIDDVYIGACPAGCSGHGACTAQGCMCDHGYQGETCHLSYVSPPAFLHETFSSDQLTAGVATLEGATRGFQCGIVGSGKPLVFAGAGRRQLTTGDLCTTTNRFLQFGIRLGSNAAKGRCTAPEGRDETVLVMYSCDGELSAAFSSRTLSLMASQTRRY